MKINPLAYGVLVTVVFFGIIGGFQAAGYWSTSGKVSASGQSIQPETGDVNSIKGWMTLEQIMTAYNVPLADLVSAFNLPADTNPQTAIKDLESDTFSVTDLRTWLDNRTTPPSSSTGTAEAPALSESDPGSPAEPAIQAAEPTAEAVQDPPTPIPTEHVVEVGTITGRTTYQEVLDWGLPQSTIEEIIGGPIPDGSMMIKDDAVAKGLAFSDLKTALQTALDQLK